MAYGYRPRGTQRRRRTRPDTLAEARVFANQAVSNAQAQALREYQVRNRVPMSDEELSVPPEIQRQRHETRYALPHMGTIPGGAEAIERAREAEELAARQDNARRILPQTGGYISPDAPEGTVGTGGSFGTRGGTRRTQIFEGDPQEYVRRQRETRRLAEAGDLAGAQAAHPGTWEGKVSPGYQMRADATPASASARAKWGLPKGTTAADVRYTRAAARHQAIADRTLPMAERRNRVIGRAQMRALARNNRMAAKTQMQEDVRRRRLGISEPRQRQTGAYASRRPAEQMTFFQQQHQQRKAMEDWAAINKMRNPPPTAQEKEAADFQRRRQYYSRSM